MSCRPHEGHLRTVPVSWHVQWSPFHDRFQLSMFQDRLPAEPFVWLTPVSGCTPGCARFMTGCPFHDSWAFCVAYTCFMMHTWLCPFHDRFQLSLLCGLHLFHDAHLAVPVSWQVPAEPFVWLTPVSGCTPGCARFMTGSSWAFCVAYTCFRMHTWLCPFHDMPSWVHSWHTPDCTCYMTHVRLCFRNKHSYSWLVHS